MKKILVAIFCLFFVFFMGGCGDLGKVKHNPNRVHAFMTDKMDYLMFQHYKFRDAYSFYLTDRDFYLVQNSIENFNLVLDTLLDFVQRQEFPPIMEHYKTYYFAHFDPVAEDYRDFMNRMGERMMAEPIPSGDVLGFKPILDEYDQRLVQLHTYYSDMLLDYYESDLIEMEF